MTETWVFGASQLSAFASGQLLGVLRILAGERRTVITGEVEAELRAGLAKVPQLNDVLQAAWLERVDTLEATGAHRMFGTFAERLVGATQRNLGEATVLTWAATHTSAIAIIDDAVARKVAREHSVTCIGTLGILLEAIRARQVSIEVASRMADIYIETNGRLPFQPGGFVTWAIQAGEIDPSSSIMS